MATAKKRTRTEEPEAAEQDFAAPWKMSDVVLLVNEQRFHVHRSFLATWSPVFEKMFTSNFREKNKGEIRLPGKQAENVKALLLMIYPPASQEITHENWIAILELAHEYQIKSIVEKCENFLIEQLESSKLLGIGEENDLISVLILAQNYKLERLRKVCVSSAGEIFDLWEVKEHRLCGEIEPGNYAQILESIIESMQLIISRCRCQQMQKKHKTMFKRKSTSQFPR